MVPIENLSIHSRPEIPAETQATVPAKKYKNPFDQDVSIFAIAGGVVDRVLNPWPKGPKNPFDRDVSIFAKFGGIVDRVLHPWPKGPKNSLAQKQSLFATLGGLIDQSRGKWWVPKDGQVK